jgi:outer membrane protein assembly factor BamD
MTRLARAWRHRLRLTLLAALVAALAGAGCAGQSTKIPPGTMDPDKLLFERGTEALNAKKWLTAREYFRQLYDGYPQSQFRADAKLGLADTYVGENTAASYVLAINEYQEFLNYYPTSSRADYAQYKLAMCHFYQMAKPERDQTETKAAIAEFESFFQRFPNSALQEEAKKHYREARDRLGQSEFHVGLYYFRARWYPGAIDRFKALLKSDPEYTYRDAVYYYLAESLLRSKLDAEALPYFQMLVDQFQHSEYLDDAQKRLAEMKVTAAAPKPTEPPKPSDRV